MLLMRFAYGIRLPLPILCGAAGIAPLRFLRYIAGTALIWALLFTWLGYLYGAAAGAALGRVVHYETWILLGRWRSASSCTRCRHARAPG